MSPLSLAITALVLCLLHHSLAAGISDVFQCALAVSGVDSSRFTASFWATVDAVFVEQFSTNEPAQFAAVVQLLGFDRTMQRFDAATQRLERVGPIHVLRDAFAAWMRRVLDSGSAASRPSGAAASSTLAATTIST
jgi:hypothetical protein